LKAAKIGIFEEIHGDTLDDTFKEKNSIFADGD
jgi:hypothetical protein